MKPAFPTSNVYAYKLDSMAENSTSPKDNFRDLSHSPSFFFIPLAINSFDSFSALMDTRCRL